MYSVISTIDPASSEAVNNLRSRIKERCKVLRKAMVLEPHMSWLGAEGGNLPLIADRLSAIAHSLNRLHLKTAGFGFFPGTTPVLYLPVIVTEELLELHKTLWRQLSEDIIQGNDQYRPGQWMPHITVFYLDEKNTADLGCAIADLLGNDFHIEFSINRFELAYYQNDNYGYYSTHPFS